MAQRGLVKGGGVRAAAHGPPCLPPACAARGRLPLERTGRMASLLQHQRLALRPVGNAHALVACFAKHKDKDVEKEAKQLKKLVKKAESNFDTILGENEAQLARLSALVLSFQSELRELRMEREALSDLVEAQGRIIEQQQQQQQSTSEPASSPAKTETGLAFEASAAAASDDIMAAISKVGFPDSFQPPEPGPGPEPQPKEAKEEEEKAAAAPAEPAVASTSSSASSAGRSTKENGNTAAVASESKTVLQMPSAVVGCDDIKLMDLLHSKLESFGFYCADDERDDWYFGDSTQNAVMSFQASHGLTENGSVTHKEWAILLRDEIDFVWDAGEAGDVIATEAAEVTEMPALPNVEGSAKVGKTKQVADPKQNASKNSSSGAGAKASAEELDAEALPMLREGDGGRHVRLLQLALDKQGFCVSEDEMEFWFFGDTTVTALKTFQACRNMPESGIVDEEVWGMLCGEGDELCTIDFLESRTSGTSESEEEDPNNIDRAKPQGVFLLGEGRYENPAKLEKGK